MDQRACFEACKLVVELYILVCKNGEFEYDLSFSQERLSLFVDAFFPKVEQSKHRQLLKQVFLFYYSKNRKNHVINTYILFE